MGEIVSTVGVSLLGLACLAFAAYIVFFPLVRTIGGGVQLLKMYVSKKLGGAEPEVPDSYVSDLGVGITMADGGEKTGQAGKSGHQKRSLKSLTRVAK